MKIFRANAKINLYLDVLSRRENGYHELYSVMQSVSLCDLVTIDYHPATSSKILLHISGNANVPTDSRNIAWRAAELFLQATKRSGEVTIVIDKHIPMAAGLAGGSTDAAAVLRGLNQLCGSPLSMDALCAIGSRLGADVPFCILGGCAVAEGIGERLTPQKGLPQCYLVIACMGDGVSTSQAYGELDQRYDFFSNTRDSLKGKQLSAMLSHSDKVSALCKHFYNIFEPVVEQTRASVKILKNCMKDHDALYSMMSGSGPSVFGVFEREEDASRACFALRTLGADAFVCYPTEAYK